MYQLELIAAIAVFAGIVILLGIDPFQTARDAKAGISRRPKRLTAYLKRLNGKKKEHFLARRIRQANAVLDETGRSGKKDFYQSLSVVCMIAAFIVGLFLANGFLAIVLACIGYMAPWLYVLFTANGYWDRLNKNLYTGLKLINGSYQNKKVLVAAVSENLDNLSEPLKSIFDRFLVRLKFIDPNREHAVMEMKEKINHPVWRQWCDALLRCMDNPARADELDCIETLVEDNEIKDELNATIQNATGMALIFILLSIGIVPYLYGTFPELVTMLLTSIAGKITIAILAALIFYSLLSIVHVHRPVKLKEGDR